MKPTNYTYNLELDAGEYILDVSIDPNTNIDGTFKAWCNDEQEFIEIDGWTVSVLDEFSDEEMSIAMQNAGAAYGVQS